MTGAVIPIDIPYLPDTDGWDGFEIKQLEQNENGLWGVLVHGGNLGGAYYFKRSHPFDWSAEACAVAIQHAANHRFMVQGPPAIASADDCRAEGPRLHRVLSGLKQSGPAPSLSRPGSQEPPQPNTERLTP